MLYLTRKIGESVIINNDIEVTVVEVRGRSIKLGFTFPPEASVLRKELHERIKAENIAAATGGADVLEDALAEPAPDTPLRD
jgi:carbon storage regulator